MVEHLINFSEGSSIDMEKLIKELILEILSYLPWKNLVQCKCLSKNFNSLISDPTFQYQLALRSNSTMGCLLYYSTEFPGRFISKVNLHVHNANVPEPLCPPPYTSSNLPVILSSSEGLLLLDFGLESLCVLNPITGAYRFIPSPPGIGAATCFGFTPNLKNSSSYKLVAVSSDYVNSEKIFGFNIFESDANTWRTSPTTYSVTDQNRFVKGYQAPYLDDSFHWLKEDATILAFNVKTEVAKIINKPEGVKGRTPLGIESNTCAWFGVNAWLGVIGEGNKLAMVISDCGQIFIYLYDSKNFKWKIKKILENNIPNNSYQRSYVYFYDGKCMINSTYSEKKIYVYDVAANLYTNIGKTPDWHDAVETCRHFFGTLAKIPHCRYLQERLEIRHREEDPTTLKILFNIQKYLSC